MAEDNKNSGKVSNNISKKSSKDYIAEAIIVGAILIAVALLVNISMFKIEGSYLVGASPNTTINTNICDPINTGDCIGVDNGGIEVEKQDQTTQALELLLTQHIANITLLEDLTLGQQIFNISSTIAPVIGNVICLKDLDGNIFTQDKITTVTSLGGDNYQIRILSGVETAFTTEDGCSLRTSNMAVDGSVTTQIFSVSPLRLNENVEWDLTRVICTSAGDGVGASNDKPDRTDFFTTGATDRGILFRAVNTIYYKNLFYARTNNDFALHMYDIEILDANKNGEFATTWRKSVNGDDKSGVVIRLEANINSTGYHEFQAIVDRDLTDVSNIECNWMGHETDKYADSLTP